MSKFNIEKRTDDSDDIFDDDEDDVKESKSSGNSDFLRKRMVRFMLIVIFVMVFLLLVLYLLSISTKHSYTYREVENIMKEAAVAYFKEYPEHLPLEEGNIVEIDSSNLANAGKMKPLTEYVGEDKTCSGVVQVEKSGTNYLYVPYLNCGDDYVTLELYRKVSANETIVTSGYGLYQTNGSYVFRGEVVNNFVKLGESMWRIVKITSNNTMYLISYEGVHFSQPWDDRYNQERLYESGKNGYSASRVREFLDRIYENPSEDNGEKLLSKKDKTRILAYSLCTGKRSPKSEKNDNTEECAETLKNQKYGLLTLSDYLYASVDPNCKSASTKSCKNYNYLVYKNSNWWLATANNENSSTVFQVGRNGAVTAETASNYAVVRPVILLNSKILYKKGEGTLEKPYTVR